MNDAIERLRVKNMHEIAEQIRRVNRRFSKACQLADQRKISQCIREHDALVTQHENLRRGGTV